MYLNRHVFIMNFRQHVLSASLFFFFFFFFFYFILFYFILTNYRLERRLYVKLKD